MEWLTIALSVLAILVAFYYYYLKNLNVFKRYGIPHLQPMPIVGNMGPMLAKTTPFVHLMKKVYHLRPDAKYVGFYEFNKPLIHIRDLDLVKSIAIKNFDHFQDHRPFFDTKSDNFFGQTLFFQKGEAWKHHRSILSPVFSSGKIKIMFKLMNESAVRYTNYLSTLPEKEREVDVKMMLSKYTNDVIASLMYGIEVDSIKNPDNELYVNGRKAVLFASFTQFLKIVLYQNFPTVSKLLGIRFMSKRLCDFFENLVLDNIKTREEKGIYRPDMLQLMIDCKNKESGKGLTNNIIASHSFGFFFGSFDTISTQTSFVFQMLAEHPDVQSKLQAEIDEVLEKNDGQFRYETIVGMEYLDAVINETMRLHGIAVFLERVCKKPFELPPAVPGAKPFTLKPGMMVWLPAWAIHRDPNNYEDPDDFKPEQFLVDGKRIMNSGAFIPFGIGPRMCIGNRFALTEMKVLLCHILSRCDIKLGPNSHVPMQMTKGSLALLPEHGFWLRIEPRKNISPTINRAVANGVS